MNEAAALLTQSKLGSPLDLLLSFFALALVPVLAVTTTSFTRIIVVLGLLRASLGTSSLPPNAVLVALALMLTGAVMTPTLQRVDREALAPYLAHHLSARGAVEAGAAPLRGFMARQARISDVRAFARIAKVRPATLGEVPFFVLAPAFLIGELRAAFAMGFALALPFAVIDILVATALMSLGMFMVPPGTIALPLKLLLFVIADGWALVVGALVSSYR
ncbi:MAG: flagellar type III secretion system pore protein FliP [Candidatus Eremiobacteraeota bacterium]|nr:flagellar type III secretion system pore protein FliP [Candidatus Eremiobacteraeota bacterium]